MTRPKPAASSQSAPRVFGFSGSFFLNKHLRRLLQSVRLAPSFGLPKKGDDVIIWGRSKTSQRGQKISKATGAGLITLEDGFVRSVQTGRQGGPAHSIIIDRQGVYFETERPSDLPSFLLALPNLERGDSSANKDNLAFLRDNHLSKYNDFELTDPELPSSFVLVIDQTFNDASINGANANAGSFQTMLDAALLENPGQLILIKTHPETMAGQRRGYFDKGDEQDKVKLYSKNVSPWLLLQRSSAVYCVSSQLGMEAIFADHKPVVFGNAFYCGLGLTDDRNALSEHKKTLTAEQLFEAAYIDYCHWYDAFFDRPSNFRTVVQNIAAQANWHRFLKQKTVFIGMRLWKRGFLRRFFKGPAGAPQFIEDESQAILAAQKAKANLLVWAGKETLSLVENCEKNGVPLIRVEDGFLRSVGLGAKLIEPVSLALDDLGIYYDPRKESRLEKHISNSVGLSESDLKRASTLRAKILELGFTKYNINAGQNIELPQNAHVVLVPGQVENDQSILTGTDQITTNLQLVLETRAKFPDSFLVFKPHPDVLAGLRDGGAETVTIANTVDLIVENHNMANLLDMVDTVSTMTSLAGFEALLRNKEVVCFGAPFYAGWGLTEDIGKVPERRTATPTIDGLVHAALIDYANYWDPVSGLPCPVEVVVERFERGEMGRSGRPSIRILAKLQGVFASYVHLWR